jgi:hypothetical protein
MARRWVRIALFVLLGGLLLLVGLAVFLPMKATVVSLPQ